jgi:hypothetical protein
LNSPILGEKKTACPEYPDNDLNPDIDIPPEVLAFICEHVLVSPNHYAKPAWPVVGFV